MSFRDIARSEACDNIRSNRDVTYWSFADGAEWAITWLVAIVQAFEALRDAEKARFDARRQAMYARWRAAGWELPY